MPYGSGDDYQHFSGGIRSVRKTLRKAHDALVANKKALARRLVLQADQEALDALVMVEENDMVGANGKKAQPAWVKKGDSETVFQVSLG